LTFELPPSGIVALIGPNGAGKTTLFNVLTGFLTPDSGDCFLGTYRLTGLRPHRIAKLGISRTFQDVRLFRNLPVEENLLIAMPGQRGEEMLAALLRSTSSDDARNRAVAVDLLQRFGLVDCLNSRAADLSYGQQKLISIGCCLATRPRIIVADEPVAGLDQEMAGRVVGLLRQLRDEGTLVIFAEHNLGVVSEIADLVIALDRGGIIVEGSPAQVLEDPRFFEAYLG
jgi:branched-chain amino acid transport system ATP-binding protein